MQDKIYEIMEMVSSAINDSLRYGMPADVYKIESKLCELVREPLSDEEIEKATGVKRGTPMFLAATGFVRATEAAHGITSTSSVER